MHGGILRLGFNNLLYFTQPVLHFSDRVKQLSFYSASVGNGVGNNKKGLTFYG